jgi:drug/metabolite transporter (DMT)-like permease
LSGALASGIGYVVWYTALPALKATNAATVQLSVPVIAALGGVVFLSEPITGRLVLASFAILGGIALVTSRNSRRKAANSFRNAAEPSR